MINKKELIINELKNISLIEFVELINELQVIFNINLINENNLNISLNTEELSTINKDNNEKIEYSLILDKIIPEKKISVLKLIRTITGLGLKESKDIVENLPNIIKDKVNKEEAEKIKLEFELAGGTIILK